MTVTAKRARSKKNNAGIDRTTSPVGELLQSRTVRWALLSAVGIWLAFPPVGLWPLGWLAPLGWIRLIRMPELDGKRPFMAIYGVGVLHWLLMTHWVTLPHSSAAIGWLFLAAYLAIYVLAFIVLGRWLVHKAKLTPVLVVPLAWVATEYLRSNLFTGFALAPLSHSQVSLLPILQIADITGAYGVSFLVMLAAAAIERAIHSYCSQSKRLIGWPMGVAGLVVLAAMGYGYSAISEAPPGATRTARVAIIQGSLDTIFGGDGSREKQAFHDYLRMTREVTTQARIDLVLWPESMFRIPILEYDEGLDDKSPNPGAYTNREWAEVLAATAKKDVSQFRTKLLVGTGTEHVRKDRIDRYNTAAFFDESGDLVSSYHKMHPVMFGEYIPLGKLMPWLYELAPIDGGLSKGATPRSYQAGEVSFCPNICFENTVPHLIRRQVRDLQESGQRVDSLVTLTNDGWFWGSSLLDLHLSCGIFRAIENRKPMLIAANTGISAHIDVNGRVLKRGPRRGAKVIVTDVEASESVSLYTRYGDVFAQCCTIACIFGLVIAGLRKGSWDKVDDKRSTN